MRAAVMLCALLAGIATARAQQATVSFSTAVDLALRNSNSVLAAQASVLKAEGLLMQTHDVYLPSLVGGSNLGYSYGFPLGQPTIFNFSTQSLIYNFSQMDYIRSARAGVQATQLSLQDARQQIIEDAAYTYIELDTALQQQQALEEQYAAANKLAEIATQRENAGIDSHVDVLRAQLTEAQIHLAQLHGRNNIASLREHLAHITGMPAANLSTETASIPPTPTTPVMDSLPDSPAVQAAQAAAHAEQETAIGDQHQLWRPEFGMSAQYSRFASFNNYAEYYKNFQSSNFGVGLQITLPVFDPERRARAKQSAAEAVRSQREANVLRDQAAEGNLKMINSLQEVSARETIARLESEISSEQLKTIITQLQASTTTNQLAPQLSPKDEQNARIDERGKFVQLLAARQDLTHLHLDLLRASGGLEEWVRSGSAAVSSSK